MASAIILLYTGIIDRHGGGGGGDGHFIPPVGGYANGVAV